MTWHFYLTCAVTILTSDVLRTNNGSFPYSLEWALLLTYLSDTSGHRRNSVKSKSAAEISSNLWICGSLTVVICITVRFSQPLNQTRHNHIRTNILLPETQQHKLAEPFVSGLPGPDWPKTPNCTSKYAKNKQSEAGWWPSFFNYLN